MFLTRVRLRNWRSYRNATFHFRRPKGKKRVTLVGAMNGTGKTSLLIALYLGLFGREAMGFVEGVRLGSTEIERIGHYRKLIKELLHRPVMGDRNPKASVELEFEVDDDSGNTDRIQITRTYYYKSGGSPRTGEDLEEVRVHVNERPIRIGDWKRANDRISDQLFPPYVMPCFFFDGEQAQKRVEGSSSHAMADAVRVLFGTRLLEDLDESLQTYRNRERSEQRDVGDVDVSALEEKRAKRDGFQTELDALEKRFTQLLEELEGAQQERKEVLDSLERLTGDQGADLKQLADETSDLHTQAMVAEEQLKTGLANLALPMALGSYATAVSHRLKHEQERAEWQGVRRRAESKVNDVVEASLATELTPPLTSKQLAELEKGLRESLLQVWAGPAPHSKAEGEGLFRFLSSTDRGLVFARMSQVQKENVHEGLVQVAREASTAWEDYRERKKRFDTLSDVQPRLKELRDKLTAADGRIKSLTEERIQADQRRLGLKAEIKDLNASIGGMEQASEDLSPIQAKIEVAERVRSVISEVKEALAPVCNRRLEEGCTRHFGHMISTEYKKHRVLFDVDEAQPVLAPRRGDGPRISVNTLSGAQRRAFGLALSLALSDVSGLAAPLVIDTPVGNADSKYRERMLTYLARSAPGQVILLSHDEEIYGPYLKALKPYLLDTYRVDFEELGEGYGEATPHLGSYIVE